MEALECSKHNKSGRNYISRQPFERWKVSSKFERFSVEVVDSTCQMPTMEDHGTVQYACVRIVELAQFWCMIECCDWIPLSFYGHFVPTILFHQIVTSFQR